MCSPANLEFTRNPGTVLELPGARMAGVHCHTWQGKVFRKGFKLELAENLEGGASAGGVERGRLPADVTLARRGRLRNKEEHSWHGGLLCRVSCTQGL